MAGVGWSAKGLLKPLWDELPGKRDELAAVTGIRGTTLSAYNSGARPLGLANARRISAALDVTLLELGAPLDQADWADRTLLGHLRQLETDVQELAGHVRDQGLMLEALLVALGVRRDDPESGPGPTRRLRREGK